MKLWKIEAFGSPTWWVAAALPFQAATLWVLSMVDEGMSTREIEEMLEEGVEARPLGRDEAHRTPFRGEDGTESTLWAEFMRAERESKPQVLACSEWP